MTTSTPPRFVIPPNFEFDPTAFVLSLSSVEERLALEAFKELPFHNVALDLGQPLPAALLRQRICYRPPFTGEGDGIYDAGTDSALELSDEEDGNGYDSDYFDGTGDEDSAYLGDIEDLTEDEGDKDWLRAL
jgi:hypothetical protein